MSLQPQTHFDRKVVVWRRLFDGVYEMNTDTLEILGRTILSACLAYLIYVNQLPGAWGGFYIMVIMGIDLAAAFEAFRESQTDTNREATYQDE